MVRTRLLPASVLLASLLACGGSTTAVPAITAQPAGATVAAGAAATFTVAASGDSLTYQWTRNAAGIAGATAASYTAPAAAAADDHAAFAVKVSNSAGSITSADAILRVSSVAIGTQPVDVSVAAGASASFSVAATGSGALSYQWAKGGAAIAGATFSSYSLATALVSDSDSYTCTVTNTLGGVVATAVSHAAVLNVVAAPAITAQPHDSTVLLGAAASLTVAVAAGDALTYQWQKDGAAIASATSPAYSIAHAAATDSGSYTCIVTNTKAGFSVPLTSSAATLSVAVAPSISGGSSPLIAEGTALSLTITAAAAAGMPAPTYQWKKDGAAISGATASAYTVASASPADAGAYLCEATSTLNGVAATATSSQLNVSVVNKPVITLQPTGGTLNAGGSILLTAAATGTDAVGYQWQKNGANLAAATTASYSVASATANDAGDYLCVVSNTRGGVSAQASTATATVVVQAPPSITAQPSDSTVVEAHAASFTVAVAGSNLTYQWSRDGVAIPGATASAYTTGATVIADTGAKFSCVISNGYLPDVTSAQATLTVTPTPISFNASVTSISKGEGVVLTYSFPLAATGSITDGATPVTAVRGGSVTVYPLANTTYTLNLTSGGVTTPQAPISVTVKAYTPTHLYVVNQADNATTDTTLPSTLYWYSVGASPAFTISANQVGSIATGRGPAHVVATPDEGHLYVTNTVDKSISAYAVAADGSLTSAGADTVLSTCASPWSSAVDPSGSRLYVACDSGLEVFSIASSTGVLTAAPSLNVSIPGRTDGDLLFHPSGKYLYVADFTHNAVKAYSVGATGALTFLADSPASNNPSALTLDHAGTTLYTRVALPEVSPGVADLDNAAVIVFAVDPYSGLLTQKSVYRGHDHANSDFPKVRGSDGHHGLTFSRTPGVDQLFNAYISDPFGTTFSEYAVDIAGGTITGDYVDANWAGSPFAVSSFTLFGAYGDSLIGDRSGSLYVYPLHYGTGLIPYVSDALGNLTPPTDFTGGEQASNTGTAPIHACFTGTLQ